MRIVKTPPDIGYIGTAAPRAKCAHIDHIVYLGANEQLRARGVRDADSCRAHLKMNPQHSVNRTNPVKKWVRGEPLRLAICLSGFMRNYQQLYRSENFRKLVNNHDSDVYIFTWDLVGYGSHQHHEIDTARRLDVEELRRLTPRLKELRVESYLAARPLFEQPSSLLKHDPGTLSRFRSQFYGVYQCQKMVWESKVPYQAVVRMRADLSFDEIDIGSIQDSIHDGSIYLCRDPLGRAGLLGDQLAIGNMYSMNIYADLYRELQNRRFLSVPIYRTCELVLARHLQSYRMDVRPLASEVTINRQIV